ncbi:hypothetical protein FHP25_03865 [Vineibacter terrae]|uniref:DUF4337 domain-containing protein n=1 Tax=Vineibacter terrae TaxID=2586908 RepID=A0A5C8PTY4_9HYPH|nr:hypothetical protein [Vineibacter terrae]TXL81676.1 hypothetical protein FHP25_03865 [Vineibacter terrae]
MPETDPAATEMARSDFWREMLIAVVMGVATLATGWSSYQSSLWGGIQTFRLADMGSIGRQAAVKEVELGQQHVLELFMLERFLDAHEDGDERRAGFLLGRLSPELQAATRAWLESHPKDNPKAARSPFQVEGYVQPGADALAELRRKQAAAYAAADNANRTSDSYVRITVFFGLVLFLAGISAVLKGRWPRRGLVAASVVILVVTLFFLARMPLAAG